MHVALHGIALCCVIQFIDLTATRLCYSLIATRYASFVIKPFHCGKAGAKEN